jgi:hypothetical protein
MASLAAVLPLLLVLAAGAIAHTLALLLQQRGHPLQGMLTSAAGQLALLAALLGLGLRALAGAAPAAWLPQRAGQTLMLAAWLALLAFLLLGPWWRAPALGSVLPPLLMALVLVALPAAGAPITRGLPTPGAAQSAFGLLSALALTLATLGTATQLARLVEQRTTGVRDRSSSIIVATLAAAATLRVAQIGLIVGALIAGRHDILPWTIQETWLLTSTLLLALAAITAARHPRHAPLLAGAALTAIVVSSGLLPALNSRA